MALFALGFAVTLVLAVTRTGQSEVLFVFSGAAGGALVGLFADLPAQRRRQSQAAEEAKAKDRAEEAKTKDPAEEPKANDPAEEPKPEVNTVPARETTGQKSPTTDDPSTSTK